QFTSFLKRIAARLEKAGVSYFTITGATPKKRRLELVNEFNANDVPVFLISLKAGGTGLNLTGASMVIHADPWWNAAAENQATDRAHRIGPERTVSVYKVIAKGTIEERIVDLQERKSELAHTLLAGSGASLAKLSTDDLIALLS
ncbi:MAG: C-terminal helicase domain-containing protein, partial [Eggerthellaceae bacterium]|nr:C-terminal helicase domain-containing protein [Eggerthellaceae bacterium]